MLNYTGWPQKWRNVFVCVTLSDTNGCSKLFHCQNQEKMCKNAITKDFTTSQVCCYTTL